MNPELQSIEYNSKTFETQNSKGKMPRWIWRGTLLLVCADRCWSMYVEIAVFHYQFTTINALTLFQNSTNNLDFDNFVN